MIKDVEGYEGLYKIDSSGFIISCKTNKELKPYKLNSGYLAVKLTRDGFRTAYTIHRLVAQHFCNTGCIEGLVVDHMDGNKQNNNYNNLRWCTQKDNVSNQIERGTFNIKEAHKVAWKKNQKPIIAISPNGVETQYESTKVASEELGLISSKITDVLKGRRKHHKQYKFKYLETNG